MRQLKQLDVKKYGFWGAMLLLIYISYLWRLESSLWTLNDFSYDEGIHLILGKLWAAGYTPYEQIFVSYPPIFLWSLGLPWKLFSQVSALRFLMTTYALLGVAATIYLATVYDGRLAGVMAGTFLSFAPDYFIPSMFIMGEIPSIGMAVVAVALAEKYRRGGSWPWLAVTGGALAFSLSLKVLPFYAVPFVGLMVISKHVSLKSRVAFLRQLIQPPLLRDVAILAASFIVVFIFPLLFFNPPALYNQVVGMRLVSREAQLNPFESNNKDIIEFLFGNPGLMALALYGLIFVAGRNLRRYGLLLLWFGFIWVSMYFHVPLRGKHLSIFLPALAVFAGFGVNHIFSFFGQLKADWPSLRGLAMLLTILTVLGMVGWSVPRVIAENNGQTGEREVNEERENAIDFIQKIATPTDCVIADNPVFLYNTQRLPPPELSETSQTRIDTGYLTLQDIIQSIETSNCHVVAVVTPRFGEISGLKDWLADHYLGLYAQSETYVYFAKKGAVAKRTPAQNGDFDGLVRLRGWQQVNRPGTPVYLSLFWELDKPVDADYLEQITLRSAMGQTYHISRSPFEGQFNPAHWQPGEQVRDTFQLELPANLPPDTYQLYLSLCHTEQPDMCLPINNQTALRLGRLELN